MFRTKTKQLRKKMGSVAGRYSEVSNRGLFLFSSLFDCFSMKMKRKKKMMKIFWTKMLEMRYSKKTNFERQRKTASSRENEKFKNLPQCILFYCIFPSNTIFPYKYRCLLPFVISVRDRKNKSTCKLAMPLS